MTQKLKNYLLNSANFPDFTNESHYHTFFLGLLAGIESTYVVLSNQPAGSGLADLILIPRDSQATQAIILEFKYSSFEPFEKSSRKNHHRLSKAGRLGVMSALKQIHERGYDLILNHYPSIQSVLKVGIVFAHRWVSIGTMTTKLEERVHPNRFRKEKLRFITNHECDFNPIDSLCEFFRRGLKLLWRARINPRSLW